MSLTPGYKTVVALLALSVLGFALVAQAEPPQPTFVAVVRHDGSMIPLAVFDGQQWWNRWPEPADDYGHPLAVPARLSSLPTEWMPPGMHLPTGWRLYSGNGRVTPIKALRPVRAEMLDQAVIGVQTNYRTARQDAVAVAVSGSGTVAPFVRARRQESDRVAAQLAERLATKERETLAAWLTDEKLPGDTAGKLRRVFRDDAQKDPSPFSLMRAERVFNGRTYYRLTGQKLYAGAYANDRSCSVNVSFDGMVATDAAGRIVVENVSASAWAGYCGDAAITYEPIAMVQVGGHLLWVGVENLEDGFATSSPTLRRRKR